MSITVVQTAKASTITVLTGGDLGPGTRGMLSAAAMFGGPVAAGNAILIAVVARVTYPGVNIWLGPVCAFVSYTGGVGPAIYPHDVQVSYTLGSVETMPGPITRINIPAGATMTASRPNPSLSTLPGADSWSVYVDGALQTGGLLPNQDWAGIPSGGGSGGQPSPITDSAGNTYAPFWVDGGAGGTILGSEAMGFFLATNVAAGTSAVGFSSGGFNGNPFFDNNGTVNLIAVEIAGLPSSVTASEWNYAKQFSGSGDLSVNLPLSGYTVDFAPQSGSAAAVLRISGLGTGNDFLFSLATGDFYGFSTPTITGETFTSVDNVTSSDSLPLALWVTLDSPPLPSPGLNVSPAWLIVDEPIFGWTDQSAFLRVDAGAQHSFNIQRGRRGQATVELFVSAGSTYTPTRGTRFQLYDQTEDGVWHGAYTGLIQDIETIWRGNGGDRDITITGVSLESIYDTIYAPPYLYEDKTCGYIVQDLLTRLEAGSQVLLGAIDEGPVIPRFVTNYQKLSDLFDQLATTALFTWYVDPATWRFNFVDPSIIAASWGLAETDLLWETGNWRVEGADYRNWQAVRLDYKAFGHSAEFFVGAGQQTITLARPCQQVVKAYATLSTCNTATGSFSGQPSDGDTVTIGPAAGAWQAAHIYALGGIIIVNGYVQAVTFAGTSGGSIPAAFSTVTGQTTGQTTTDNTVIWTCQGPAGLSTGTDTYTFKTTLDHTQFGQVLIGATASATCQNLADAINANAAVRGTTFSLPTWECNQDNAINVSGTSFTLQQKAAGTGYSSDLSTTSSAFTWTGGGAAWAANTNFPIGAVIAEGGFWQQVTLFIVPPGISGGSPPSWNNTTGGTTSDGTLTWTCRGAAPGSASTAHTTGGTSPQGSLSPKQGATIELQVYEEGTSTAAPGLAYKPGSAVCTLATPLNTGSNLNVEYTRADGNVIEVADYAAIAAFAALTKGTGKVQQIEDISTTGLISTSAEAGLQYAQQALAAYKVAPKKFSFETYRPGLIPGVDLTAVLALPTGASALLNGDWVIDEISAQIVPVKNFVFGFGGHYRYTIRAVNTNVTASYLNYWTGRGGSVGGSGGGGGGAVVPTSGGIQTPQNYQINFADGETPSGAINGSNVTFTLAHTPSPAASLQLCVNGVLQLQGADYTISTVTITFTSAPSTNATIVAFYRY